MAVSIAESLRFVDGCRDPEVTGGWPDEYIVTFGDNGLYSEQPLIRCRDCAYHDLMSGIYVCKFRSTHWEQTDEQGYCHRAEPE